MIEIPFTRIEAAGASRGNEVLQQYVQALLARQRALDILETIHQEINQAWTTMRRLLEGIGLPARAGQAVRVARAAQAALAQETYRALEKRREDFIAALQDAERRAHAAWQKMLSSEPKPATRKNAEFPAPARPRNNRPAWRSNRRGKGAALKFAPSTL